MKVTKERQAANRDALIRAAGALFREHGVDGVGVAQICKAAGLTHGALYAQFPSKDALVAEALTAGLAMSRERARAARREGVPLLTNILDYYLAPERRDDIGGSCALAASASEAARQDREVSARFRDGLRDMAEGIAATVGAVPEGPDARARALGMLATMIGGLAISRAVQKADPAFADEILAAVRAVSGLIGGEPPPPVRKSGRRKAA